VLREESDGTEESENSDVFPELTSTLSEDVPPGEFPEVRSDAPAEEDTSVSDFASSGVSEVRDTDVPEEELPIQRLDAPEESSSEVELSAQE
jgi:hypothetical protein